MSILEEFEKYYNEDIYEIDEAKTDYSNLYKASREDNGDIVCLKIINKNQLKKGEYNYHLERIKREEEITRLCKSEYTVNLNKKFENENIIIFELEYFEKDLAHYLLDEGPLNNNENNENNENCFKDIVLSLAKALKILQNKGVMHRDIKPENIFIDEDKNKIKLGDFGCSIKIKDNKFETIGTYFYTAPEIIKNLKYDEKCDLWSLGVTLYELYFGELPYGKEVNTTIINKAIYDEKNFRFKKSNIPTLDILFKRLLVINPKERMNYDEFFSYIFNKDFLKKDAIIINNYYSLNYKNIYEIILKEIEEEKIEKEKKKLLKKTDDDSEDDEENDYEPEGHDIKKIFKKNINKILNFVEGYLPDIMDFPNANVDFDKRYNNIIYYDENIQKMGSIKKDSDYFERHTPGAYFVCTSINSLNMIKEEILRANKNDKRIIFNLITTGSTFEKVMQYLDQNKDFKNCIINACIFCLNLKKYEHLKYKYPILHDDIYNKQCQVVDFINMFSAEEIRPFPLTKLVTYEDYIQKYKERHFKISQFYGDLTKDSYDKYYEKMKSLIEKESKENQLQQKNQQILFQAFLSFDLTKDLDDLDKLIIKEYTKNTFYRDLNKWLVNSKTNYYESVAYFTARLMFSLNSYAYKQNAFCTENKKEIYRGIKLPYSCLIPYKRAKGRIIILSSFTSTTENVIFAKKFSGRDQAEEMYQTNLKFSVIFIITNFNKQGWVSSGIDIHKLSKYKKEKEVLFQPFSFYYVRDVQIDTNNCSADIYLETIGKTEILEEKIKYGKEVEYNKELNIIEIKK